MARVNIVKKIKVDGVCKLLSLPRNQKGTYDWSALPQGLYLIEWYAGGKRRRESTGATAAQALEAQRRKKHELEGRELGLPGFEQAGEAVKKPPLHVAVRKYLERIEALKKPNTHRKYEAVLDRFLDFCRDRDSIEKISADDLTQFMVALKKDYGLGANTILHNAVIIAQFLKRHGRSESRVSCSYRAHHIASEGVPGGRPGPVLRRLLRRRTCAILDVPADWISGTGSDVPVLERHQSQLADGSSDRQA